MPKSREIMSFYLFIKESNSFQEMELLCYQELSQNKCHMSVCRLKYFIGKIFVLKSTVMLSVA